MSERARLHLELFGRRARAHHRAPERRRHGALPAGRAAAASTRACACCRVSRLEHGKGVEDLVIAIGPARAPRRRRPRDAAGPRAARGRGCERIAETMGVADRVTFPGFVPYDAAARGLPRPRRLRARQRGDARPGRSSSATRCWRRWPAGCRSWSASSGSLPEVAGRDDALVRPHDPVALADALEALHRSGRARRARRLRPRSRAGALRPADGRGRPARHLRERAGRLGPARVALGVAVEAPAQPVDGAQHPHAEAAEAVRVGEQDGRGAGQLADRPAPRAGGGRRTGPRREPVQRDEVAGVVVLAPRREVGDPDLAAGRPGGRARPARGGRRARRAPRAAPGRRGAGAGSTRRRRARGRSRCAAARPPGTRPPSAAGRRTGPRRPGRPPARR